MDPKTPSNDLVIALDPLSLSEEFRKKWLVRVEECVRDTMELVEKAATPLPMSRAAFWIHLKETAFTLYDLLADAREQAPNWSPS